MSSNQCGLTIGVPFTIAMRAFEVILNSFITRCVKLLPVLTNWDPLQLSLRHGSTYSCKIPQNFVIFCFDKFEQQIFSGITESTNLLFPVPNRISSPDSSSNFCATRLLIQFSRVNWIDYLLDTVFRSQKFQIWKYQRDKAWWVLLTDLKDPLSSLGFQERTLHAFVRRICHRSENLLLFFLLEEERFLFLLHWCNK